MITTNDEELAWRIGCLRTHGITRDNDRMTGEPDGPWYYQQLELGFNYRMTDIQAALGASQLGKLNAFSLRRREIARLYDHSLADLPLRPLARDTRGVSGWHLYMIRLNLSYLSITRRQVFERLRAQGIGVNVHYIPVHLQPDYQRLGFKKGMFPESERYYEEAITLPLFPAMRDEDVLRVKQALENVTV
jgi:dTDP-4-amino-4,6-dideoxygalactose transaminase